MLVLWSPRGVTVQGLHMRQGRLLQQTGPSTTKQTGMLF